ncbi:MAG TPA: hypothetical protein VN380_23300 [Thermoanaerobaculia bacterium]|jgi:hypothetical protein|nr:hypothetical protein [Thermoanaerobaculia bacterium]
MTVCIAVTPRFRSEIILVSDQLLSSDVNSVEGGFKFTSLAPAWYVMFAGHAPRFRPLIETMCEPLGDTRNTRFTVQTIMAVAERAYYVELTKLIEIEILSPFGISRDDFVRKGRRWFGATEYSHVLNQIGSADLGIELLVVGVDAETQTQLFSVSSRGAVSPSVLPYHAIGSGAYLALGALYQLAYFPGPDLTENVYRTCAAKFAAEAAPGVGRETHVMVTDPLMQKWAMIFGVDDLRKIWQTEGQPRFPPAAKRTIYRDLKPMRTFPPIRKTKRSRPKAG